MAKTNQIQLLDQDGNIMPTPPADSDVMQLIYLLEYGRMRGFKIGPTVQVGTVTAQVVDTRIAPAEAKTQKEPDIFEQHGYTPE